MFDEERFDALLEEAFKAGYDSAIAYIYDESAFNLAADVEAYTEAQKNGKTVSKAIDSIYKKFNKGGKIPKQLAEKASRLADRIRKKK